ncbi:TonB-dependent receptor [Roseateles sp. NT4]|uniref:TonB-dependent receptor n=1 Tax=Roseateles sp. NT4 TaxID=3453715 RepID=UPI003EF02ED4
MKSAPYFRTRHLMTRHLQLRPVALACTGLMLSMGNVYAQAEAEKNQLDTVVITGIRRSLESSVDLKRERRGLVDGIVAEDIGKFPDSNLAESMQRIAGVSIDRAPSGEGSKVTVRGVGPDFNMVLLNGRQMPTATINNELGGASGSRAFDFANLSSDSISALEVFKTSRASSPTGGIGATINVKTARPLDLKERIASVSVKAGYDASNARLPNSFKGNQVTPEISGLYSETFADGKIGVAVSGSYSKRDSGSNKAYTLSGWYTFPASSNDWGSIPPKPATGPDPITNRPTGLYSTSVDMRYSLTALQRERLNGQVTLQYAPSKDLKFTLDYTLASNTIGKKNAEYSSWFNFSHGPATFTDGPVATPIIETALFPNNDHDLAFSSGIYGEKSKSGSTGFNAEWKISDALRIEADAHHSTAKTNPNSPYGTYSIMDFAMFGQGTAIAYYDQKLPLLSLPTTVYDPNKQQLSGSQFNSNLSDQTIDQIQTQGTYKLSADSKLIAGLGFTRLKNRSAAYNNSNNDWGGVGAPGDFTGVKVSAESLPRFFNRIPGHDDPRLTQTFYVPDFESLRARALQVIMAKGAPGHPSPMTQSEAEAYLSAAPDYTRGNDWRTTEKSSSAFVQWDRSFEAGVPMDLSVGVRYESTKIDSSSQVVTRTGSSWGTQNEILLGTGSPSFGQASGKYSYVLPSIDWDADINDNLKLRASYGQNIGRPGWDALVGGVNVSSNAKAGGGTGSTGNPNLKPLLSKNLDFSAEYYYAKSSYLSANAFYKKVSNFIGTATVNMTLPGVTTPIGGAYYRAAQAVCGSNSQPLCLRNYIFTNFNGQPGVTVTGVNGAGEILGTITGLPSDPLLNFAVTTPSNEKGDNIKGLEFTAQHLFGKSGFGIAGNYTWVRTGLKYDNTSLATQSALVGVSNSANLVGFFEDDSWSIRGAYNWRGEFLAAKVDGAGNNPVYTEPYGQVDVSVGYKIGKSLTLQADLINLNDGYIRQHGRAKEQVISVVQTGRRYLIGARYRF